MEPNESVTTFLQIHQFCGPKRTTQSSTLMDNSNVGLFHPLVTKGHTSLRCVGYDEKHNCKVKRRLFSKRMADVNNPKTF